MSKVDTIVKVARKQVFQLLFSILIQHMNVNNINTLRLLFNILQ